MDVKILVSTHKWFEMPKDQQLYMPIQVGCDEVEERFGFQGDNTGENISYKHRFYSDLSSVYWGWKNLNSEYMGSCHYRRYFVSHYRKKENGELFKYILSQEEVESLLKQCPVIVARKRNYYIETIESHYRHTHNGEDFDTLRAVIKENSPEYLNSFERVAGSRSAHIFNMFIMRRDYLDSFCSFMFPILFEVERRTDFSNRNEFESRVCGYLAEFLLDTWIIKNGIPYKENKIEVLGGEKMLKKAVAFLCAKYFGKKYKKSF